MPSLVSSGEVDCHIVPIQGGLHDRLGKRRVPLDHLAKVFNSSLEMHGQETLADKICGVLPENMDTDNLSELLFRDDFDKPIGLSHGHGLGAVLVGKLAHLDVSSPFSRASFSFSHTEATSGKE